MNILFLNQHGSNRGDHAAFLSQIDIIKEKYGEGANLTVIYNVTEIPLSEQTDGDLKINHVIDQKHRFWTKILFRLIALFPTLTLLHHLSSYTREIRRYIAQSDVIFLSNGGANIGPYKDWKYLSRLCIAVSSGKSIESFGNSISPSSSSLFDRAAVRTLGKLTALRLRDQTSQIYADRCSLAYIQTLDIVFHMPPTLVSESQKVRADPYVVFVPNELYSWHPHFSDREDLRDLYHSIIARIISLGFKIVLLPQLFGDNHIHDHVFFTKLTADFTKDSIEVVPESVGPVEQISIISKAKMVVGGRYHSIVFSIISGRPFVSLSYESKMEGMLRFLDLEDYNIDIRTATADKVEKLIDLVLEDINEATARTEAAREYAKSVVTLALSKSARRQ